MQNISGQKRVVITDVMPRVEEGQYPAKVILGKPVVLSASIFCDGHDELMASALYKHEADRQWKEVPLQLIHNDHWEASINIEQYGNYLFQIQAAVDHFRTWQNGLVKKHAAGQDLQLEFAIGAELLDQAIARAAKTDRQKLLVWQQHLRAPADTAALVTAITADEVTATMRCAADKKLFTKHPKTYRLNVERPKAGFSTWYELFPRSASAAPGIHGTFQDVKRLLPRIAMMGFDVLYLPPVHPIGTIKRKGKNNSLTPGPDDPGSPWAIGSALGGHKSLHPQLGTLKDFKDLVRSAKKQGIEIAMDIALQCAPDHPYVKEHPQWFKWRPDGTVQFAENPPKRYEDILPLNFETDDWPNLWQELKSIFDHWISQGVEIFRVDNPHTKSFYFWEWCIDAILKEHPQVIFLAEAFTRPRLMERLAKAGFTQSYTYFTWRNTVKDLQAYVTELTKTDQQYYFRPNFWPNTPDILPPELTSGGDNKHIIRLLLAATLSSNYGLYGPVYEFGLNQPYPGKEEYIDSEKYEIRHWDWNRYTKTAELIAQVNAIRKAHPALQTTANITFADADNHQIICYVKVDKETNDRLIIAVNLDPFNTQSATVSLPLEALALAEGAVFSVTDLLSGDVYEWQGSRNFVQLNPYDMPAHILKIN